MASKKSQQAPKNRWIKLLLLSGGLNVLLVVFLTYTWMRERPPIPYCVLKPAEGIKNGSTTVAATNGELLRSFKEMSIEQLIAKLSNRQPVECGYTQRDIALGWLVDHHHFNLSAALLGLPPLQQSSILAFGPGEEVAVTPAITETQYEAIIQYVRREQWPFTSEGLFLKLKGSEFQNEPSLIEAFSLTPEFHAVETLFSRGYLPISKKELIAMLKEGDWQMLHTFTEQQRMSQDLSQERRQRFLLDYAAHQSPTAANLLLQQDADFAAKRLNDKMVITQKKQAVAIAKTEPAKLTPIKVPPQKKAVTQKKTDLVYLVQDGDSLWKISRKFNVDVNRLKKHNGLKTDTLKIGTPIRIPA